MSVDNVNVVDRADGVITAKVKVRGEMNRPQLKQALLDMFEDREVQVSQARIMSVSGSVATVSLVTKGQASSNTVENQLESSVANANSSNQSDSGNNSSSSSVNYNDSARFFQIDFVQGQPIEDLQGPNGTYTNDQLIRFAHGNNQTGIRRSSDGEFTTNDTLAKCVKSDPIKVHPENDTATVRFGIAEGCAPITLTLASYEKPDAIWSPESEAFQEFVDSDTITITEAKDPVLVVDLPGDLEETENAEELEETQTAANTDDTSAPTDTVTSTESDSSSDTATETEGDTSTSTATESGSSPSTPSETPTATQTDTSTDSATVTETAKNSDSAPAEPTETPTPTSANSDTASDTDSTATSANTGNSDESDSDTSSGSDSNSNARAGAALAAGQGQSTSSSSNTDASTSNPTNTNDQTDDRYFPTVSAAG